MAQPYVNEFLDYLEAHLNFAPDIIQAMYTQRIMSFRKLKDMSDTAIHDMCVTIRRQRVPNILVEGLMLPPVAIATGHELLLQSLAYYLRHLERTQREFDAHTATEAEILRIAELVLVEKMARIQTPKVPAKLDTIGRIRIIIDDIEAYCSTVRGSNGVSLSYVIRPMSGLDEDKVYPDIQDEMNARAPHFGKYWHIDNAAVWDMLREVLCDTDGWAWISFAERTKNGRSAFLALKTHYIGDANQSLIKMAAEGVLANSYFDGTRRGFTLEKYAQAHKQAHKDLADYDEGLPEGRKVRLFLTGIRYPLLDAPRGTVLATPALRDNFDETVSFLLQFNASLAPIVARRNVGAVIYRGPGRGGGGRGGRGGGGNNGNRGNVGGRFFGGRGGRGQGAGGGGRFPNRYAGRGGRGGGNRGGGQQARQNADGRFIPLSQWVTMDPAQQQRIRDIRSEAARAVKRERDDTSTVATAVSAVPPAVAGRAGDQMSQRSRRGTTD
jgi:hypothetical protein